MMGGGVGAGGVWAGGGWWASGGVSRSVAGAGGERAIDVGRMWVVVAGI